MNPKDELIARQKCVADHLLKLLSHLDENILLAGGAPRDWYFNKPATDLDIYIQLPKNTPVDLVIDWLKLNHVNVTENKSRKDLPEGYTPNPHLLNVLDAKYCGVKVQLMLVDCEPIEFVENFPLSICKIWYKDGKIGFGEDFTLSADYCVIYTTNTMYGDSEEYTDKILAKFPTFKYFESLKSLMLG